MARQWRQRAHPNVSPWLRIRNRFIVIGHSNCSAKKKKKISIKKDKYTKLSESSQVFQLFDDPRDRRSAANVTPTWSEKVQSLTTLLSGQQPTKHVG